jgi:hypothetical protein
MSVGRLWIDNWQDKTEMQYHFVHHKSHIGDSSNQPDPAVSETGDETPELWHNKTVLIHNCANYWFRSVHNFHCNRLRMN